MSDPATIAAIQAQLTAAEAAIAEASRLVAMLNGTPTMTVTTPTELDAALGSAQAGTIILIDPALRYLTPLTVSVSVTLQNLHLVPGRATRTSILPRFADGLTVAGANVHLAGIEILKIDPLTDIVVLTGGGCLLDGCRVLGDPTHGAKRGIAGNAPNVTVVRCYVDDCFGTYPGNDTQAFAAWNSPGPFLLQDNFLCGGSETILFGGADPSSQANIPSDITIRGNTITKNQAWQTQNIGVKNLIEFKNARRYTVVDNDISYCWGGHGQDGYVFELTPRNQDGGAPYSEVFDGVIENNRIAHAAAFMAMLGHDSPNVSLPLDGLTVSGNTCTDIDPVKYTGADKLIFVGDGPKDVTISGNTFGASNVGSVVYLDGAPQCVGLQITKNTFPPSTYGVMGSSSAPAGVNDEHGSAWTTFVASGTLADNTVIS